MHGNHTIIVASLSSKSSAAVFKMFAESKLKQNGRKDNVLKFSRFEERLICGKRIRVDDKLNRRNKAAFPTGISTAHSELID